MSIASGATLDIENFVTGLGATLDGVNVINSGTIQVDRPGGETIIVSLLLDGGTTVTGGTLLIYVDFPTSNVEGALEIGTGGATLDKVTVENNNILQIDDGAILTLTGGAAIDGGATNDGTVSGTVLIPGSPPAFGNIDVTGSSSVNGSIIDNSNGTTTTIDANLNNGYVTVEHGVTLTLDNVMVNGTIFNDVDTTSIIQIDDGTTLTLNHATIQWRDHQRW